MNLFRLVATILVVAISSSCMWALPAGQDVTTSGEIRETLLHNLIGSTKDQVVWQLGEPTLVLSGVSADTYYYIYEGHKEIQYYRTRWQPNAYFGRQITYVSKIEKNTLCYLLIFDANQRVARYKADEGESRYCPSYFWSDREVKSMLDATAQEADREAVSLYVRRYGDTTYTRHEFTDTIRELAKNGDRDSVFLLAQTRIDKSYLERLALQGDLEAATYLALALHTPEPLRALANKGNRDAAIELVKTNGEVTDTLRNLAKNGDQDAAFLVSAGAEIAGRYPDYDARALALALAHLRWQHEQGLITDDEYMLGQRKIIDEHGGKRQSALKRPNQPADQDCEYIGGIRHCN